MKKYKKIWRYALLLALLFLVGYNSVYFEKLDQRKTTAASDFDAEAYARRYIEEELTLEMGNALEINELLNMMDTGNDSAFSKYSHALGIGNIRFFLVKGEGVISAVQENHVEVLTAQPASGQLREPAGQNGSASGNAGTPAGSARRVRIATEYVFGNAVRDASGLITMNEFDNTMELNDVSAAINKIIREEVLPPFKSRAKKGDKIRFTGAVELNREYPDLEELEIMPITLSYTP